MNLLRKHDSAKSSILWCAALLWAVQSFGCVMSTSSPLHPGQEATTGGRAGLSQWEYYDAVMQMYQAQVFLNIVRLVEYGQAPLHFEFTDITATIIDGANVGSSFEFFDSPLGGKVVGGQFLPPTQQNVKFTPSLGLSRSVQLAAKAVPVGRKNWIYNWYYRVADQYRNPDAVEPESRANLRAFYERVKPACAVLRAIAESAKGRTALWYRHDLYALNSDWEKFPSTSGNENGGMLRPTPEDELGSLTAILSFLGQSDPDEANLTSVTFQADFKRPDKTRPSNKNTPNNKDANDEEDASGNGGKNQTPYFEYQGKDDSSDRKARLILRLPRLKEVRQLLGRQPEAIMRIRNMSDAEFMQLKLNLKQGSSDTLERLRKDHNGPPTVGANEHIKKTTNVMLEELKERRDCLIACTFAGQKDKSGVPTTSETELPQLRYDIRETNIAYGDILELRRKLDFINMQMPTLAISFPTKLEKRRFSEYYREVFSMDPQVKEKNGVDIDEDEPRFAIPGDKNIRFGNSKRAYENIRSLVDRNEPDLEIYVRATMALPRPRSARINLSMAARRIAEKPEDDKEKEDIDVLEEIRRVLEQINARQNSGDSIGGG